MLTGNQETMEKESKGLLAVVLIMLPVLWLVAAAVAKVSYSDSLLMATVAGVFFLINFLFALGCVKERTVKKVFFLFVLYTFVSFAATILITIIALFIAFKTGVLQFGKIGG